MTLPDQGAERPLNSPKTPWARSWPVAVVAFTVLSVVLTRLVEQRLPASFASGGLMLVTALLLWWSWRRAQVRSPSPVSEYQAVAYSAAFYVALIVTHDEARTVAVEWLVLIPPVSILPLVVGRVAPRGRSPVAARRMHLIAAGIFALSALLFLLTVIAIVLVPIPLVAAVMHYTASRFYR